MAKNHSPTCDSAKTIGETDRYLPMTKALNAILIAFRGKAYPGLPMSNDDIIFMRNDPGYINADQKSRKLVTPKKPDVIGLLTSRLEDMLGDDEPRTFAKWCAWAGRRKEKDEKHKLYWSDVQQFWEFKKSKEEITQAFWLDTRKYTLEAMLAKEVHLEVPASPTDRVSENKKRKGDSPAVPSNSRAGKASRGSNLDSAGARVEEVRDGNNSITTPEQCAYYAIERLSAAWHFTHCTGVEIDGKCSAAFMRSILTRL